MGLYIGLYILMAILTFAFNLLIIGGEVTYPFAIIRNALLWPVMLPVLIYITIKEMS